MDSFGGAVPLTDQVFPSPFSSRNAQFGFFITGASTLRLGKNATNVQRQINIVENLSVVSGSHQLKFGVDYRRLSPTSGINEYFQAPSFSSVNQSLTGTPSSVIIQATEPGLFSFTNLSPYAQDTWKVGRRLTLTYGLRWEYNPPPSVGNGPGIVTVQGLANPSTISLAPQGTPPFKTTYANFAPRVGVAYQLSRKQGKQMMLRGGFGIFYDLGVGNIVNAINQSFPYSRSKSISNVSFPLTPGQAAPPPLTLTLPTTTIIFGFDPTLKLPRTYQWNLAVEQSLGTRQTVSASYVGAAGRRLLRLERLGRPNPNFSTVQEINNLDTSDYHAMQLQYNRRLSRGLQALASYTWSHSIDTASADTTLNTPDQRTDPRSDRGPSDFDVRHSFNAAVTYKFPAPASRAVERAILGNWSIDSIFTLRSATPVDVRYGRDIGFGFFQLRPDIVQGIPLYLNDPNAPGGKRFNNTPNPNNPNQKGPFLIPIDARQGTLGRNSLRGFPAKQVDLAIRRQFNISEGVRFQLKAEFFNVFNHPNFADPFFFLTSGLFGQSTQMLGRSLGSGGSNGGLNPLYQIGGPRSIQLALRLQF